MCCTVGVDEMDWGQAGEKRKPLPPFVLYLVSEKMAGVGEQSTVLRICLQNSLRPAQKRKNYLLPEPITHHLGRVGGAAKRDEMINYRHGVPAVLLPLSPDRAQLIPTPVDRRIQTFQQRRTVRRIGEKPSARHNCSSTGRRYRRVPDVVT